MQRERHYINRARMAAVAACLLLSSVAHALPPVGGAAAAAIISASQTEAVRAGMLRQQALQAASRGDLDAANALLRQADALQANSLANQAAGEARQSNGSGNGNGNGNSNSKGMIPPPAPPPPPPSSKKDSGGDSKNQSAQSSVPQPSAAPSTPPMPSPTEDKATADAGKQIQSELASLKDKAAATRAETTATQKSFADSRAQAAQNGLDKQINSGVANRQRLLDTVGGQQQQQAQAGPPPQPKATGGTATASAATSGGSFQDRMKQLDKANAAGGAGIPARAAVSPQSRLLAGIDKGDATAPIVAAADADPKNKKAKARGVRKTAPRLAWGLRAKNGPAVNRWVTTHEPPRTLTVALEKNRRHILGSTRRSLNRLAGSSAKDTIDTALRSRREVLRWGDQPARSREEAPPPPPTSVAIEGNPGESAFPASGAGAAGTAGGHSADPKAAASAMKALFPNLGGAKK